MDLESLAGADTTLNDFELLCTMFRLMKPGLHSYNKILTVLKGYFHVHKLMRTEDNVKISKHFCPGLWL